MRLTEKVIDNNYVADTYISLNEPWKTPINKLGQLEDILEGHNIETLEELDGLLWYIKKIKDIEEELGIDLITLLKALTKGIYRKTKNEIVFYNPTSLSITKTPHLGWALYHRSYTRLFPKDYGKTWALTKEELQ